MRKNLKMIKCPELSPEQLAAGRERRRRDLERCEMRGLVHMYLACREMRPDVSVFSFLDSQECYGFNKFVLWKESLILLTHVDCICREGVPLNLEDIPIPANHPFAVRKELSAGGFSFDCASACACLSSKSRT